MPTYKYRVLQENGAITRGKVNAKNKTAARDALKAHKMQPTVLKRIYDTNKKYKRLDYTSIERENQKRRLEQIKSRKIEKPKKDFKEMTLSDLLAYIKKPKAKDIIAFVNNLYILKKSRFNNVQALQALYEGEENPTLKDIIENLLIGVESGEKMWTVMEYYPKQFPPIFVNFIKVGEESGSLDTALLYARDYVEESTKIRKQVRKAVIPRVLQFVGIIGAMMVALVIGVPLLESVYTMFDSNQEIPAATMFALNATKWLGSNILWILLIVGAIIVGGYFYVSSPMGRYRWDKFKMRGPIIGNLITNLTVSEFFQAMLLNLRNGMRIQEALEVSRNVTKNYYFLSAIEQGKANALSGDSWIDPFVDQGLFKPMVKEMISIGMQTDLAEMMAKVNEYIKAEVKEAIDKFSKALPEVTYIFVGIALIAFVITVMVPLVGVYMGSFISIN